MIYRVPILAVMLPFVVWGVARQLYLSRYPNAVESSKGR